MWVSTLERGPTLLGDYQTCVHFVCMCGPEAVQYFSLPLKKMYFMCMGILSIYAPVYVHDWCSKRPEETGVTDVYEL